MIRLIQGDCIEEMRKLAKEDVKIDLVLTDLPYGTTKCKWDNIIPFNEMWRCIYNLVKPNAPILLFGVEPFNSELIHSNIDNFKYTIYWDKLTSVGHLVAKIRPLNQIELISVFSKDNNKINYYPVISSRNKTISYKEYGETDLVNDKKTRISSKKSNKKYPTNLIQFSSNNKEVTNSKRLHPTQKPVDLLKYLIKTYSLEGDTVLDFTMGSGSTGVACLETNRNFIGIELDEDYYNIAKERCSNFQSTF